MKKGRGSKTAELVCMGRAIGSGQNGFEDPTAYVLLPDAAKAHVDAVRSNARPRSLREGVFHGYLRRQAQVMIVRTTAIDDVVRAARAPQLVILGAGLDGRAWRMRELEQTIVFEIDHPDTQHDKRARIGKLAPCAREVRFVPVDFQKDSLVDALASVGHDATKPTTWIWEGVVMYLTKAQVDATLSSIARCSARGSTIALHYHHPALFLRFLGLVTGALGEPFRSRFRPGEMRALLDRHDFTVQSDANLAERGAPVQARHMRMATATKR